MILWEMSRDRTRLFSSFSRWPSPAIANLKRAGRYWKDLIASEMPFFGTRREEVKTKISPSLTPMFLRIGVVVFLSAVVKNFSTSTPFGIITGFFAPILCAHKRRNSEIAIVLAALENTFL